jgi:hypothetical protein
MIFPRAVRLRGEDSDDMQFPPAASWHDLAQEGPLLRQNELVLFREIEVR